MNGDNGQGGGIGCVMWLCIAMAFGALILVISGGDDTTHTSADLEALSRNQINIASKVNNSYFDCNAAGSCLWTDTTTSTSTTSTRTDINGNDNKTMYSSSGTLLCVNPNDSTEYGNDVEWCKAAGVTP